MFQLKLSDTKEWLYAVSYTHLDVYKRQAYWLIVFLGKCGLCKTDTFTSISWKGKTVGRIPIFPRVLSNWIATGTLPPPTITANRCEIIP